MKKLTSMLCVCALLAGCSNTQTTPVSSNEPAGISGTFEGKGMGRNKDITLSVSLDNNVITAIDVVDHNETDYVSDAAFAEVIASILEQQSVDVDNTTGATLTSFGIKSAVKDALKNANLDPSQLENKKIEKTIVNETIDADLVVVGGGATGTMAAVLAAEADPDLQVVLLETNAYLGGSAVVSGGYIGASNPPEEIAPDAFEGGNEMIEEIIASDPVDERDAELLATISDEFNEYLKGDQSKAFLSDTLSLRDYYIEYPMDYNFELFKKSFSKSDEVFYWFYDRGANFAPMIGVTGYSYPGSTYLEDYYSGSGYFYILSDAIKELKNLNVMLNTSGTEIMVEDGKTTGVKAESSKGDTYTINAENVILAYGGFAYDTQLVIDTDTYFKDAMPEKILSDNLASTGSQGIKMAEAAGAKIDYLGFTQLFPLANPVTGECHDIIGMDGMLVNNDGKRTVDESSDRQTLSKAMFAEDDNCLWLISDANVSWIADGVNMFGQDVQTMIDRGYLYQADTLEELAEVTGIHKANFLETIQNFNAAANGEIEDEQGRLLFGGEIAEGPFYAQKRTPASHITYGGVVRDDNMTVLNENDEPIQNLYVVGDAAISWGGINDMTESALLVERLYK